MKIKKIGDCFDGDVTQYAVVSPREQIVALFFYDNMSQRIYRLHIVSDGYSAIKQIIEAIENEKIR